jgi:microcystin-dependent protein
VAIGVQIPLNEDTPQTYVQKVTSSLNLIDDHDHSNDPVERIHSDAVDGTSLEVVSNQIRVKDGGIGASKLHPSFGGFVPPGTIIAYAANAASVPSGFLLCDGTTYNYNDYPTLGALMGTRIGGTGGPGGTFKVPDLRGYFLRGRDTSATVDPDSASRTYNGGSGNLIGSYQTDQLQSHNHTVSFPAIRNGGSTSDTAGSGPNNQNPNNTDFTLLNQNSVTESRPKSVYVEYLIKT